MTEATKIQEVFGKFVVALEDGPKMFDTEAEAQAALTEYENGAEQRELAAAYCAHMATAQPKAAKSFQGKAATGKSNVIASFLAWVDAGQPGPIGGAEDSAE